MRLAATMVGATSEHNMQDDFTRRKIFWLLQRLTSLSLWTAKYDAFKIFASAYETAIRAWSPADPEPLPAEHLTTILEILSLYDEGLNELSRGRRFVWRSGQALASAFRKSAYLADNIYPYAEYWDRSGQIANYPAKVDALARLLRASQFQGEGAATEVSGTSYHFSRLQAADLLLDPDTYDYTFYRLAYPTFPAAFPAVPDPSGPVIHSGQTVPCDGVWEPVFIETSRVSAVIPLSAKLFRNNGCFNYFVKDTSAPNLEGYDSATYSSTIIPTRWRLLWEDRRYVDSVVPDESQYFLKPSEATSAADRRVVEPLRTGDVCPVTGEWRTEEYGGKTVCVEAGKPMPDLLAADSIGERKVHWVTWHFVKCT